MALPAVVGDDEQVVSYVLEESKFKHDGIDHRQLMPSRRYHNTSVFRTDGQELQEIANQGHNMVALPRPKPGILGWATLAARDIRITQPLTIRSDEPPDRHALIEGWPAGVQDQRAAAMRLASKAVVVRRSTVPP